MVYNKITLAFPEKAERLFRQKYFSDSLKQFRAAYLTVIALYALFGYLDSLVVPKNLELYQFVRYAIVIPILLAVYFLSFTKLFSKIWQELLLISSIVGGIGTSIMVMYAPENAVYYGGMMLVFFASYFMIKLRFFMASLSGWIILIFYNIGAIFITHVPGILLFNHDFFFISSNLIGMFAAYNIEYYERRSFYLNLRLDEEKSTIENINKNLEQVVETRTKELQTAKEISDTNRANITAIIEGTKSGIWAFNGNYEIIYINRAFQLDCQQAFGILLENGSNLLESFPEEYRDKWKPWLDRVLNNEQFTIEETLHIGTNIQFIQVSFNPIIKAGEVMGGTCFSIDITETKLSELELTKAKNKAEESDRLKTAFLQNMSHEIRTPMNAIIGFSSLLTEYYNDKENLEKFAEIIKQRCADLLEIINAVLDISKIESGQLIISKDYYTLSTILDELAVFFTEFQKRIGKENIEFKIHLDEASKNKIIFIDKGKIKQIFINLVSNAFKFTESGSIEGGYIIEDNDNIVFYVKDTGIGIPTNKHAAIFERFSQLNEMNTNNLGGTGLGLSIVKGLVLALDGVIWLESSPHVGSTFFFRIPTQITEYLKTESVQYNSLEK